MGLKNLPELAGSTTKQSVKSGVDYLGEKIYSGTESVGNTLKSGAKRLKSHASDNFLKLFQLSSLPEDGNNDPFFSR